MNTKVAVVVVALFSVLTLGCGKKYPEEVRKGFMDGCMQSGASHRKCKCGLEWTEGHYTLYEFQQMEEETISRGKIPYGMKDMILACRDK
jgi:hypothetical protein